MRVTLAVPKLLAVERAALAGVSALARLARYAETPVAVPSGFDAALLVAAGLPRDTPTAPLAARGAGFDPGDAYVLRADPVTLIAGRDDVFLAGRAEDLAAADAALMTAMLNRHFAADGLTFHAPRPDAWFVTTRDDAPSVTTALSEVSGPIHAHLPRGDHAKAWRRWSSEIQMLLHEHPVERRARGGRPRTGHRRVAVRRRRRHRRSRCRDGVRRRPGLGAMSRADWPATRATHRRRHRASRHCLLSITPSSCFRRSTDASALNALVAAWIDPAVRALERHALSSLALVADGSGGAFTWDARAPSSLQRLRARFAAHAFVAPGGDGSA